jgi:acyl-CoA synthetase (AMP-forming)/AMP-acid ligase II
MPVRKSSRDSRDLLNGCDRGSGHRFQKRRWRRKFRGHLRSDVAVFGVPNEDFGEEVKAVVQPVDINQAGPDLQAE